MSVIDKLCVKRLIQDVKLIRKDPLEYIDVVPDATNMLIWYFLIKGPNDSVYEGGYYIGVLEYPSNYPLKPPSYIMLTPSGRFTVGTKICLSNSGFHANEWDSTWTVYATLNAFLSIMMDNTVHGVSHITMSDQERIKFAKGSVGYNKSVHKMIDKCETGIKEIDFANDEIYNLPTKLPSINKLFKRFIDENGNPK